LVRIYKRSEFIINMKKYCYIKDGVIESEPQELPNNFENVENFNLLNDQELKTYGWLPYEEISDNKPVIISHDYQILKNKVICYIQTRDKTQDEIDSEFKIKYISEHLNNWNGKYCFVKNGIVELGAQDLPINFENVSNFNLLDFETLKSYGWLPYELHSENKPIFVRSFYEVLDYKIIEHYITRDKTEQEIQHDFDNEKQNKWNSIREKRNNLLKESDVYVVSDRWEEMDISDKQKWSFYRNQLRNIPQNFNDPDLVEFPNKPL
jgi:hypothetical protein